MTSGRVLYTSSSILNTFITLEAYSLIICVIFGIVLAASNPMFTKLDRRDAGDIIPFYNIFSLCNAIGYSELFGILLLIPVLNVVLLSIFSFGLRKRFSTSTVFNLGLFFLPMIFIPILAYGNANASFEEYDDSSEKDNDYSESTNYETESVNLRYSTRNQADFDEVEDLTVRRKKHQEIKEEVEVEGEKVDSIFKTNTQLVEKAKPYRAKKIVIDDEFVNSKPAERERIEKVGKKKDNE